MTIEEFKSEISKKYTPTKIQTTMQYIIRLGKSGSVIVQYHNDKFEKFLVAGKEKNEIEQFLENNFRDIIKKES